MRCSRWIGVALTILGVLAQVQAKNLVANGGFEAIDTRNMPQNWSVHAWTPKAAAAASTRLGGPGKRFMTLEVSDDSTAFGCFSRAVDVSSLNTRRLLLSFRYRSDSGRAQAMVVGFKDDFMVNQWGTRPLFDESRPLLPLRIWNPMAFHIELLPGTQQVVVVFQILAEGTLDVDDVVLRPVPDEVDWRNLDIGRVASLPAMRRATFTLINRTPDPRPLKITLQPFRDGRPQAPVVRPVTLAGGATQDIDLRYSMPASLAHRTDITVTDADTGDAALFESFEVPALVDARMVVPAFRNAVMNTQSTPTIKLDGRLFALRDLAGRLRLTARLTGTGATAEEGAGIQRQPDGSFTCALPTEGLLFGEHQVRFTALLNGTAVAEVNLPLRRLRPTANEVTFDVYHHLWMSGRQVFPIGIYNVRDPEQLENISKAGINVFTVPSVRASWDLAQRAAGLGMGMIVSSPSTRKDFWELKQEKFGGHPALLGWELIQRPDAKAIHPDIMRGLYEILTEVSPSHPVVTTLSYPETMAQYARTTDVIIPWELPIPQFPLSFFAETIRKARAVTADTRPLWALIQATGNSWATDRGLDDQTEGRLPTPAEVRALAYTAILNGANGLMYYAYSLEASTKERNYLITRDAPELWKSMATLNAEIQSLAPIFTDPDAALPMPDRGDDPVQVKAWRSGTQTLAIAVNTSPSLAVTTFTIPESLATDLEVVGEARRIRTDRPGTFGDAFQPYAVHVYRKG